MSLSLFANVGKDISDAIGVAVDRVKNWVSETVADAIANVQAQIDALRGSRNGLGTLTLSKYGGPVYHRFGPATLTVPDTTAPTGTEWIIFPNGAALTINTVSGAANVVLRGQTAATSVTVDSRTMVRIVQDNGTIKVTAAGPDLGTAVSGRNGQGNIPVTGIKAGQLIKSAIRINSEGAIVSPNAKAELTLTIATDGQVNQIDASDFSTFTYILTIGELTSGC